MHDDYFASSKSRIVRRHLFNPYPFPLAIFVQVGREFKPLRLTQTSYHGIDKTSIASKLPNKEIKYWPGSKVTMRNDALTCFDIGMCDTDLVDPEMSRRVLERLQRWAYDPPTSSSIIEGRATGLVLCEARLSE